MGQHWTAVDETHGVWIWVYETNNNRINCIAVRLQGDDLMVVSPGTDPTPEVFAELEALGTVVALVSPGAFHHLGFPAWHAQYPDVPLYTTTSGVAHIHKQHKGNTFDLRGFEAFAALLPESMTAEETPGKHGDLLLRFPTDAGETWMSNEYVSNIPELPKAWLVRKIFEWTDSGPGLTLITPLLWFMGAKKPALKAFFQQRLDQHPPQRLVPVHGDVITGDDLPGRLQALFDSKL
jgi:hypothetical protein